MGLVFEELIRKFAELSNETAGEHFTPREVIALMVDLLFVQDDDALTKPGVIRTIYDPTAGTGGMLSVAEEHLREHNPRAAMVMAGQELNPESYAICKADMLIKGQDVSRIVFGNTLSEDGHAGRDVRLHALQPALRRRVEEGREGGARRARAARLRRALRAGPAPRVGRFAPVHAAPALEDAPGKEQGGCRFGIVLNGSPLFTGGAGSGESEIRRYLLENDLVEASSPCPRTCSTTPASPPMSGSFPTGRRRTARARCSSSMRRASGARCARASAPSGAR